MKIEIHITPDALMAVNKILKRVYELPVSVNKEEKVYRSIGFDLADKFEKKCKSQIKKANLFDKKKVKITLMYHEAWALEAIINSLLWIVHNDYQDSLLQSLAHSINQKLA